MKPLFNRFFLLFFAVLLSVSHAQDDTYYDDSYEDAEYADEDYVDEGYEDAEYADEDYVDEGYEDAEYADEVSEELSVDQSQTEEQPKEPVTPTSIQTIVIPILQTYKPPIVVDPENPALPSNHLIKRLRGTLWRGTERILSTNRNDVVQEMRIYIFFAEDRDAVGFRYVPYHTKRLPEEPLEYMNLNPLLQTNTYNPLESPSLKEFAPLSSSNKKIVFEIDNSLPGTQPENMSDVAEEVEDPLVETPEEIGEVDPLEPPVDDTEEPIQDVEATEEYDEYYEDEYYSLNIVDVQQAIQSFVAQSIAPDQYVVNIGGRTGGIFIHKTRDPDKPYKVIFLSLEQGITLHALTIDNSFDARNSESEAARQATELYRNILDNKINMAKYQRVIRPFESFSLD